MSTSQYILKTSLLTFALSVRSFATIWLIWQGYWGGSNSCRGTSEVSLLVAEPELICCPPPSPRPRVKIDAINVSRFESHIESPHRTILYTHAWKPYDSRGVGNFTRREMSEKNIIQLMRTARQRAQMETGMYRPFLPYFCMLELHNFYIILH